MILDLKEGVSTAVITHPPGTLLADIMDMETLGPSPVPLIYLAIG